MKIPRRKSEGSVLLVILVATAILGIGLASYLNLISNQNLSVMRSQAWNESIAVLEAGLEEALTHLQYSPTNLTENGWVLDNGVYVKERALGDNRYVVTITPGDEPVVVSRGFVRAPLKNSYIEPPRTVRLILTNQAMFSKGMVAKGNIDLSGNNVATDSFDSSDPNYSTNGNYDPAKAKDNGDVATNLDVIDSLGVWNAQILGRASTGPGGTVKMGPQGVVGSKAWHDAGNTGIEPGWSNDDMNVHFPDVQVPFSGGAFSPAGGVVDGVSYTYVLTSGNWQMSSIHMSGQEKMLVLGDAVLYVTGDFAMTGNSQVIISDDSSLHLYVGGATASLGGNGIMNKPGNASTFYYFGLPSNTQVSLSGNAAFTGAIYAPDAHFTLGGGGSDEYDFVGASVTGSVKMNGKFKFHYDENLGINGPRLGYVIRSWNEI